MDLSVFAKLSFIVFHGSYFCFSLDLNMINLSNIGLENTRRLGIMLKVVNGTGFLMCARYCEQFENCGGFNHLQSHLLCELFHLADPTTEIRSGWRYVADLSWLQKHGLSKHLRSSSCTTTGRNLQLSGHSFYCQKIHFPTDCGDETMIPTQSVNGVYRIEPIKSFTPAVYCHLEADSGGWTVIQRRQDGSVDFFRGWKAYKKGFGSAYGEYWLDETVRYSCCVVRRDHFCNHGDSVFSCLSQRNDLLHRMTTAYQYSLRIDMEHFDGTTTYAEYSTFHVAGEDQKYRLTIGGYSGDAGDALSTQNKMMFSTNDNDNDIVDMNCAITFHGAWWYRECHTSNLNGLYYNTSACDYGKGIVWRTRNDEEFFISLKTVVMKIKRNDT